MTVHKGAKCIPPEGRRQVCLIVRRFYYILLTVTYGLVCSMITYLFQMYLILMIY